MAARYQTAKNNINFQNNNQYQVIMKMRNQVFRIKNLNLIVIASIINIIKMIQTINLIMNIGAYYM